MKKILMVDPEQGWQYGFPKPLPDEYKNKDFTEWLIAEGYPKDKIKFWENSLGHIPCRMYETESVADEEEKNNK